MVLNGLRIFIVLTLAGFFVLFYITGSRETLLALRAFRFQYFLLALFLVCVDFIAGGSRMFVFIRTRKIIPNREAFRACFKANLANIFLAAATPFQTGGGLAQIYMLHRAGIPISLGTSVGVINFVATLTFLFVAGIFALQWLSKTYADFRFQYIITFSSIIFYIVALLFFLFLFRPRTMGRLIEKGIRGIGRIWNKKKPFFEHLAVRIHAFTTEYASHILHYWRNEKTTLFHNAWITILLFMNKCFIAYVIIKGMGFDPDFLSALSIQILLIFIIYFCPTPGASFLAETSAAALVSLLIPAHVVSVFSVLWRFFTTYFGVLIGGAILMRSIGSVSGIDTAAFFGQEPSVADSIKKNPSVEEKDGF